jgi:hypothetical protein
VHTKQWSQVNVEVLLRTTGFHRRELIQTLEGLRERDLEACEVFEDAGEDNRFLWRRRCTDLADAERWLGSEHYRTLMGAIKVLGSLEGVRMCGPRGIDE